MVIAAETPQGNAIDAVFQGLLLPGLEGLAVWEHREGLQNREYNRLR